MLVHAAKTASITPRFHPLAAHARRTTGEVDVFEAAKPGTRPAYVRVVPTDIDTFLRQNGWEGADSWQRKLLAAADRHSGSADGKITVREVDDYLASPDDLQFLTSAAMQKQRALVANVGRISIHKVPRGWQRDLAAAAAGEDGILRDGELNTYLNRRKKPSAKTQQWLPDQKLAPFLSEIADRTHERDDLTPVGDLPRAEVDSRTYMRFSADHGRRVPHWVSHRLTAADMKESSKPPRKDSFEVDPHLADWSVNADYDGILGRWDTGHHKAAEDAVDWASMVESTYLSNVSPHASKLNKGPWKWLELATRELVSAHGPGTTATIVTGSLFQDAAGNALPDSEIKWLPEGGQKRVAIPAQIYKAVLLRFPDGKTKTFAFLCPNENGSLTGHRTVGVEFLKRHRISVDALEAKVGFDLFGSVDDRVERRIEADANPHFIVPEPALNKTAALLWGIEDVPGEYE